MAHDTPVVAENNGFNMTSLFGGSGASYPVNIGNAGRWGPPTATLDWCEENYIVTHSIAEFWNTLTNVGFIFLAALGVWSCLRTGSESRMIVSYVALGLVGCGSALFHGTLTYEMQLLDELPMLLATCTFVYSHIQMYSFKPAPMTVALMSTVFVLVTASYVILETPIFFQAAFGLLTLAQITLGLNNIRRIHRTVSPAHAWSLVRLSALSISSMILAVILWSVDQVQCGKLQHARIEMGYPLRPLLELHGWWHFLSGFAGYVGIVAAQKCRLLAMGKRDFEVQMWGFLMPVITVDAKGKSKRS
ncbi:Alkaline ceramidase 3 [Thoreauomyces humboldtii]|nr:Alkaline ceramidase 3 [Thoreauomyces humboldtii]